MRRLCRRIAVVPLSVALLSACSGPDSGPHDAAPREPVNRFAEAVAVWNDGRIDEALAQLDTLRSSYGGDAAFWTVCAEAVLDLAEEWMSQDYGDPTFLLTEARESADRAIALDVGSGRAHLVRSRALQRLSKPEEAWDSAMAATRSSPGDAPTGPNATLPFATAAALAVGRAGLDLTILAIMEGREPEQARVAEAALRPLLGRRIPDAAQLLADTLAWTGRPEEARAVLVMEIPTGVQPELLLGHLKNLSAATPSSYRNDCESIVAAAGDWPIALWYLGDACWLQAAQKRAAGNYERAAEALDRAEEAFLLTQAGEASFAATCQEYLHLVRTARGWLHWTSGSVSSAAQAFSDALAAAPERLEAPGAAGETLRRGIDSVAAHYFANNRLVRAREFFRQVLLHHNGDAGWLNNFAFLCRDTGVAAAAAGDNEAAVRLWDESLAAYSRVVELLPEDARMINDRALMIVYHTGQSEADFEEAESALYLAIDLGAAQLDALPGGTTQAEREGLEQAVGDAWENLAYLDIVRRKRFDRAPQFLDKSVRYWPYEAGRNGAAMLRELLQRHAIETPQ